MTTTVICPVCRRQIGNNAGLQSHMKAMHRDEWRREQEAQQRSGAGSLTQPPAPTPPGDLRWDDPPRRGRVPTLVPDFEKIIPQLKRNPGRWARFRDYPKQSTASTQAKRLKEAFPDLEFIGSRTGDGSAIFARYVEESA